MFIPAISKTKPFSPAIENDIDIIYHRKEKYVYAPHLLIASLIFIFFIAAWNKVGLPVKNDTINREDVAAKPYLSEEPQSPIIKETATKSNLPIIAKTEPAESTPTVTIENGEKKGLWKLLDLDKKKPS